MKYKYLLMLLTSIMILFFYFYFPPDKIVQWSAILGLPSSALASFIIFKYRETGEAFIFLPYLLVLQYFLIGHLVDFFLRKTNKKSFINLIIMVVSIGILVAVYFLHQEIFLNFPPEG